VRVGARTPAIPTAAPETIAICSVVTMDERNRAAQPSGSRRTALRDRSRSPDLGMDGPSCSGRRFRLLLAPNTLRKQARTSVIDGEVFCGPPVRTPRSKSRRTNQARALLPPIRRRLSPPGPNGRTVTSQGSASGRFTRAIGQRNLFAAPAALLLLVVEDLDVGRRTGSDRRRSLQRWT
jgi:hypothetical protein